MFITDKSEGAKAMLDQAPATTPIIKAKENQYKEDPPQINIHINGRRVVKLV